MSGESAWIHEVIWEKRGNIWGLPKYFVKPLHKAKVKKSGGGVDRNRTGAEVDKFLDVEYFVKPLHKAGGTVLSPERGSARCKTTSTSSSQAMTDIAC